MNTMITDAAVEAACQSGLPEDVLWREMYSTDEQTEVFKNMRAALEAALPLLAAPEAGNPVSVSERERFEVWAKSENFDVSYYGGMDDWYKSIETHSAWRAWQAARQPVGEVPDKGPWEVCAGEPGSVISDDFTHDVMLRVHGDFGSDEALANYCTWLVGRLNAAPPQQPERVDLSSFREAVQYASRTCPHEDLAPKLHELLTLINQQESKP